MINNRRIVGPTLVAVISFISATKLDFQVNGEFTARTNLLQAIHVHISPRPENTIHNEAKSKTHVHLTCKQQETNMRQRSC